MSSMGNNKLHSNYTPDLYDQKNESSEDDETDRGPDKVIQSWDVFEYFPPKLKTGSNMNNAIFNRAAKVAKIVTYCVLFILTLGGGILAKGTIIFAVSQLDDEGSVPYCDYNNIEDRPTGASVSAKVPREISITWYWCIVFAFAVPEVLGFVKCIFHWFFIKPIWSSKSDLIILFTIEGLHTIGLALLFFIVLPELNSIQAVVASSCTCFVPALLGLFSWRKRRNVEDSTCLTIVFDAAAFGGQLCGIIFWLVPDDQVTLSLQLRCILPLALVLISCRWWGNFVSLHSSFGFIRYLSRIKQRLQESRGINQGYCAIERILVFFIAFVTIAYCKGVEPEKIFNENFLFGKYNVSLFDYSRIPTSSIGKPLTDNELLQGQQVGFITVDYYYLPLVIFAIHVAASFITYSCGKFAVRTFMESYGFALPITLVAPASVATIILISAVREYDTCFFHKLLSDYAFFDVPKNIRLIPDFLNHWYPWLWIVTLASQVWITRHIWSPHSERLAATERIFLAPTYDTLIIDQSIVLNRCISDIPEDESTLERLQADDEIQTEAIYSNHWSKDGLTEIEQNDRVTRIIACATMWHETADEMTEFFGSILRLDNEQGSMRFTQESYNVRMNDYYEYETHIFFDDAFRCMHGCEGRCKHDENETQVNDYVMDFINTVRDSVERLHLRAMPPMKYPAPYGGRLEWTLPGKTKLTVHLKDKNKIRHRKRWSQVMYMYYLLGYRLMDRPISLDRKEAIAENTYLLTLDGDIDFRPSALKVLLDLMKRDGDLGAACGRIHPMGTGPMVWFQKFEYAIGHWLQKSTEHTIGSVLCSPGCFSLFRAKALMEHNVMRKYAIQSTEPRHYVQYDQGEDRWLCTLILQVGYRVEYSAASDSYTHAPETFNEFYNQRRRWIPSTIANIFDLLNTADETRKVNNDISWLYIAYQWVLMGSTVVGPGTIFLMMVGALVAAFRIDNWSSFGYNLIPIAIFVGVCFTCKANIQLMVAGIITSFYGLIMVVVLVGIMIQITEDGWVAPSTILFFVVAGQLIIAGLLHPQESACLVCGIVYYVTVPSMYLLLIIFSLFNVNNVTWGTRDSKTPAAEGENAAEGEPNRNEKANVKNNIRKMNGKDRGSVEFSLAGLFKCILCTQDTKSDEEIKFEKISQSLDVIASRLDSMERQSDENEVPKNSRHENFAPRPSEFDAGHPVNTNDLQDDSEEYTEEGDDDNISVTESEIYACESTREAENFLVSPYWLQDERLRKGGVEFLSREEETFWEGLIEKYLHPIEEDKKQLAKTAEGLKSLRDEFVFKFFMVNALFVLIVFLMQLNKDILYLRWPLGETYNLTYIADSAEVHLGKEYLKLEPIGCLFIVGFVLILGVQFIAMLFHRFNTFAHILANTEITCKWCTKPTDLSDEADLVKHADDIANGLQQVVENHAGSVLARRMSTIAPGKRKAVQELLETQERRNRMPASIDALFRRNLNDSRSEISRLMSTRMPLSVFEAFERRRSTLGNEPRQSRIEKTRVDNPYHDPDDLMRRSRYSSLVPPANSTSYTNRAFVFDESSEDPYSDGITLPPHRQSRVKFEDSTV